MDSKSPEDIDITKVEYGNPPPWLEAKVWDRELRLWACDCAERVLPAWETWAKEHAPEHLEAPRKAVEAAREGYNSNTEKCKQAVMMAVLDAWTYGHYQEFDPTNHKAWKGAIAAQLLTENTVSLVGFAAKESLFYPSEKDAEEQWQKQALVDRLTPYVDRV